MTIPRLDKRHTVLLVIDLQERLLPAIAGGEQVVRQAIRLIEACKVLDVPILVTEQYRSGLGPTVPRVAEALPANALIEEKQKFSACVAGVRGRLEQMGRAQVLLCGIEAHVCVLQTAMDLSSMGYLPAVVWDAVGSRHETDYSAAKRRMDQLAVTPMTVEMAVFEMLGEAGTGDFRSVLPIMR